MAKSKLFKLQQKAKAALNTIKNMNKKTKSSYLDDINNVVGISAIKKLISKFETLKEINDEKPITKQTYKNEIKRRKIEPLKDYYIKADIKLTITYTSNRVEKYNRNGRRAGDIYVNTYTKDSLVNDYLRKVSARTESEARQQFINDVESMNNNDEYEGKQTTVDSIDNINITLSSEFEPVETELMYMRSFTPLNYDFIPSDDRLLFNENFCVPDQFISTYSPHIKKLNLSYFTELCNYVRGDSLDVINIINPLDEGIDDKPKQWQLSDGVTPKMLTDICRILNISTYAYDITNKCFLKHIPTSYNYPAFVYYAVNNHCYHITDKHLVKSLTEKAKDSEHKVKSNCIKEDEKKTDNIFETLPIYENIEISNLLEYKDCIIIYKQNDLNKELDEIIGLYNTIPKKIKNHVYSIVYIHFNYKEHNIHLYIDPNDSSSKYDYKYIQSQCKKLNLQFTNQSFTQMITQLKKRYFDNINKREVFSTPKRIELWKNKQHICNKCCKTVSAKLFEIDHIKPICIGGTNDISNLQILCKGCHKVKTSDEREQGYFKSSETESSFNSVTKEIFESKLTSQFAFIEPICEKIPKKLKSTKIYNIDINKCRKNILYYQQYNYPLFTVMDKPEIYKGQTETGLYYVETTQYFPFRGNGWYSYPLIDYALQNNLIKPEEIKYVIVSSLEIPADYYNAFIDYLYSNVEEAKLSVNSMIGNFKIKAREQWTSELITTNPSNAFQFHLQFKDSIIDVRKINDINHYQLYSKTLVSRQETDAPIYNQILALEAIELHKLKTIIESKGGLCLDLNTDCISCVFKDDVFPFQLDGINLSDYYYDEDQKVPKYKLEYKDSRLKIPRLEKYQRTDIYEYKEQEWNILDDIDNNDFSILVNKILDSKQSINIDGRAGTGKSTLINLLQSELKKRGISYRCIAPTNKSARVVNGSTIHKFVLSSTRNSMTDAKYEYLFIDEISMVHEYFYKFFITLKKVRPDLKFIIAGDFSQLLPVNDRLECDYKNSPALYELSDGQRLQLTKCRRSDDTLFNICNPDNIKKLKKTDFNKASNDLYVKNLTFTNVKRKEINDIMMHKYINQAIDDAKRSKKKIPTPVIIKAKAIDENSQNLKLMKGMPIIASKTTDKYDIMNNETFTILDIDEDTFIINVNGKNISINTKEFTDIFHLAFAMTVFKSQGQTFNENYCIYEWERFDKRMKYVALSRATDLKYIHIN